MLRLTGERDFTPDIMARHRRDAVISEAVSSSPYITRIYGYCANSAVYDFGDGGDLMTNVLDNGPPPEDQMLYVAHRIVASVADFHLVDEWGHAATVDTDLHWKQWIMIDGQYYLNDFNNALLLTWSKKTNATIPYIKDKKKKKVRMMLQWFAPAAHFVSSQLFCM
jgi:hypothetical protein